MRAETFQHCSSAQVPYGSMKARRGEGHLTPGHGDWSEAGRANALLQSDMCMECGKRADGHVDATTANYYCEACWLEWAESGSLSDSGSDDSDAPGGTGHSSAAGSNPLGLLAGYGSD